MDVSLALPLLCRCRVHQLGRSLMSICRMVEHNVALIVGCMPGFAGLIKTKIPNSSLYQSFRSKLGGSSYGGGSSNLSKPTLPGHYAASMGKNDTRRSRMHYYEMDELVNSPKTQVTTVRYQSDSPQRLLAEDERGILRTTDVAQSYQGPPLTPHAR